MKHCAAWWSPVLAMGFALAATGGEVMDLAGTWRFALDEGDVGVEEGWHRRTLGDTIALPGTTDQAGKGQALDRETMRYARDMEYSLFPSLARAERVDARGFLVREHVVLGRAWYQRDVEIPADWVGRPLRLMLERVLWQSRVWLDDRAIGDCDSLAAPHGYDLGMVEPGVHRLTICVDNRMIHNTGTIGHAYGPETQSRWNGIVGEITLTALAPVWIDDVQAYPRAADGSVRVALTLGNATGGEAQGEVVLEVERDGQPAAEPVRTRYAFSDAASTLDAEIRLGGEVRIWDEFDPALYTLRVSLPGGESRAVRFGFRDIRRDGRHILLNGRRTFLRGTLDCCVYPKTGHPPTDLEEWRRVLGTIKDHGFNHVRFHTWCPPEAAFAAADELGLYLAPETMFWVDAWTLETYSQPRALGRDPEVLDFVRREIDRIHRAYGNHPSFALFCIGNEFAYEQTDWDQVDALIADRKARDPRRLYAGTTARRRVPADDVWVTHDSGAATRGIGPPHTDWDFAPAAAATDLPVIAHETGQRPVFPDYAALLPKFTGPLKPYNYERLQRGLLANGLADRNRDLAEASARFQLVQYKAEHEAMQRTPDYGGYQLLMLNDFTGQSEALVGILDPFWEPKGFVAPREVRAWNAPTVLLARFASYTWQEGDTFSARLEAAHYGPEDIADAELAWALLTTDGTAVAQGQLPPQPIPTGGISPLGSLNIPLTGLQTPAALTLRIHLNETENQWPLWVYPTAPDAPEPENVLVTQTLDDEAMDRLRDGGRVLLLAHGLASPDTAETGFASVYWSAGWWGNRFSSLGILCDPAHPALARFPTQTHSNWQWFPLTQGATTFDLTDSCPTLTPIIQPIPDFHYNRRLAHLFETRINTGRLLVCGYDLTSSLNIRLPARQLRQSLLQYAAGNAFHPTHALDPQTAQSLWGPREGAVNGEQ